ncbi:MAG: hypothetical protein V7L23_29980 [Nostoc sp.]|uniref:hypothetical protein n=1 Tax=Nostoc sp. TaxID=1180 RepID=UPI002FF25896
MISKPISQSQASRLWAIAHAQGLKPCEVRSVFSEFGIVSTALITTEQYDHIIHRIQEYAAVEF